ncbi:Ferric-pseudobactin 358 receptor [Pseudomonas reidholzensis]|uniref:Ferric-pseudobactin 358 receptor n=1 Tax=Pseudomonas reidholzensis TaxID=1785162 RepID=A0A383RWX3_9PSED|nr:TonB-dependent receptor [Pseudomonas reidholzensis]SYX91577.1 Ferric-pseudobactin 358 receptor [Pseudomonas reidholzensis]
MSLPHHSVLHPLAKALLIRHAMRPQRALSKVGLGLALSMAVAAQVQAQEWTLDIPAQSLNSALQALAKQTDTQLLYSPEDIGGLRSTAVKGRHDLQSSLRVLLQGTGLRYQIDGNTVTVTGAAAGDGQVELSATNVNSVGLGATTEGTGSYTTGSTNTATKMNLSIRETPQSVSVITRQRMDDQQLNSVTDVLNQTPGITMSQDGGLRYNIYSRGSAINTYQLDGVTTTQENQTRNMPSTLLDMTLYDRVEVVRGATGLMTGAGEPGGVVNLIRKRPTREFQSHIQGSVGSWDFYRSEADVSGPLNDDGSVRGRLVAAKQKNGSFRDWYKQDKDILYGVLEADLSDSTLVRFGVDYQKFKGTGSPGVPLLFTNGKQTDFSRSTSSGARWMYDELETTNYFMAAEHKFANDWQLKLAANYMDSDRENYNGSYQTSSGRAWINEETGAARMLRYNAVAEQTQRGLDLTLQGPFSLFGRTHEFITGFNYQDYKNDHTGYDIGVTSVNFYEWDNYLPRPTETGEIGEIFNIKSRQRGSYAAFKFNIMDDLNVIVGARTSDYDYNYYYAPQYTSMHERGEVTPYAGITYDLTPEQSVYASYTDIFKPQSQRNRSGAILEPVVGSNYEVGWKGEFYGGRLNANTALFLIKRDNLAVQDGDAIVDGTLDESAYKAAKGTETKGIDMEISGEVLPGWQVQAGYSHARTEDADGVRQLTQLSMDTFRFWNTYRLPGDWNKLTVGGGVSWNSSTSLYFSSLNARATQDDYSVASVMARYQVTDKLAATLNLNNIFDEKYYSGIGGSVGHYGDPRNATMNLRYDF